MASASRQVPLWLTALITFSGTLAMHIFVPALPQAGASLGAGNATMQMTVSFYILGLAVGQLIYGPLSDRFGRRPVLICGLTLYTLAGFAAAFAPGAQTLIGARLLQALGGSSGMVLGRAIVRDGSSPETATRRLALMNLMVTLGPGVAPMIGAALAAVAGWRSIFYALCLLGVTNLLLAWLRLPETGGAGHGHDARTVLRNYRQLAVSPKFLGYAIGGACATTSFYAIVSAAPFIFTAQLHRPEHELGFYLAVNIVGFWLGSLVASRLVGRVPNRRLLTFGNLISVGSAAAFMVAALAGHLSVWLVLLAMATFTFGSGLVSPAAVSEALAVNPRVAGSASGLYGFGQMVVGALCSSLAGLGGDHALSAALVLLGAALVAQAAFHAAASRGAGHH